MSFISVIFYLYSNLFSAESCFSQEEQHLSSPQVIYKESEAGLKVWMGELKASSLVVLQWRIDAGRARESLEQEGISEITHNLVFNSSMKQGPSLKSKLEANGASVLFDVERDYVNTRIVAAKGRLEKILNLLHFTFRDLSADLTVEKLPSDLSLPAVVSSYNNSSRFLRDFLFQTVFRVHPYRRSSTDRAKNRDQITRDMVERFYEQHYRPEFSQLSVVGADVFEKVEKWIDGFEPFADKLAKPGGQNKTFDLLEAEPPQRGHRSVRIQSDMSQPALGIAYQAVSGFNPDFYVFELIAEILANQSFARLKVDLIDRRNLAQQVSIEIPRMKQTGPFLLKVTANRSVDLERIKERVYAEIYRMRTVQLSDEELKSAALSLLVRREQQLLCPIEYSDLLAQYGVVGLNGADFLNYPQKILSIKPSDIRRVAEKSLNPEQRAVVTVNGREEVL